MLKGQSLETNTNRAGIKTYLIPTISNCNSFGKCISQAIANNNKKPITLKTLGYSKAYSNGDLIPNIPKQSKAST